MMYVNYISLALLCIFGVSYLLKLLVLSRKDSIRANVLGKQGKSRSVHLIEVLVKFSSFLWLGVWFLETLFSDKVETFISNLYNDHFLYMIGLLITASGVIVFILAMVFMKTSWRVGIDKQNKSSLVTNGIYRFSRNPAFVGFYLMFIGIFFTFPNYITLFILIFNLLTFHLLIKQEEKHLTEIFGDEYVRYKKKTPRYLLFFNYNR